jgi:hypothetical protein
MQLHEGARLLTHVTQIHARPEPLFDLAFEKFTNSQEWQAATVH